MSDGIGGIRKLRTLIVGLADRLDATSTSLQKATARLYRAESKLTELRKRMDADIPEDTVIAISVAVSVYLGNHGEMKVIRYDRRKTWAAQGRQIQQ